MRQLVSRELDLIRAADRRAALEALIIAPRLEEREWDYGQPAGQRYPCWVVAEAQDVILVYCQHGFGPEFPWGFLFKRESSLGMDSQWCWYLEEAFVQSGLWAGFVKPGCHVAANQSL